MDSTLISIIIPTYNGEKHISKCIDSILKQTYSNFELIVVNDGSTDETERVIRQIEDSRIKLYSIANHGVSYARNYGIDKAKGKFILFVDDDDYIAPNTLEILENKAMTTNADIIRFNGFIEDKNHRFAKLEMPIEDGSILNSTQDKVMIVDLLNSPYGSIRCYSPLLFIKNENIVRFDVGLSYLEDKVFYLENMLRKDKKILFINEYLYYYNYNQKSKTKNTDRFLKNIEAILDAKSAIIEILKKHEIEKESLIEASTASLISYRLEYLCDNFTFRDFKEIASKTFSIDEVTRLFGEKKIDLPTIQKVQYSILRMRLFRLFYINCKIKKIIKKKR